MQTLSPRQFFNTAVTAEQSGDDARAAAFYRRVAICVPEDSAALLRLGLLAQRSGDHAAVKLFLRVLTRKPDSWIARASYAEALAANDDHQATFMALKELLLINPGRGNLWLHLATAQIRIAVPSEALTAMQRSLMIDPSAPFVHGRYGFLLRQGRRITAAITHFRRAVILQPGNNENLYNLAVTLPLVRAVSAALPWLRACLMINPLNANTLLSLGRFLNRHGDKAQASLCARRSMVLEPGKPGAGDVLATAFRRDGNPAEAVMHRRTLAQSPDDLPALMRLGQLYEQSGKFFEAATVTLQALRLVDDDDQLILRLRRLSAAPSVRQLLAGTPLTTQYHKWLAAYGQPDQDAIDADIQGWSKRPMISIILPVHDPDPQFLQHAIASVRQQRYPDWQLCICDDASRDPAVIAILDQAAAADRRILLRRRLQNGHISRASNDALEDATGDFVGFLDHDDRLADEALYWVAKAIRDHPQGKLFYSDEDKIDTAGERFDPHFKPDWSPHLILSQNYVCHLAVYDRDLVAAVGGLRVGYEGSQDHDLVLRVSRHLEGQQIHHIPRLLYHWRTAVGSTAFDRDAKPYALAAAQRAVSDHLQERGITAKVSIDRTRLRLQFQLPSPSPRVTIIVPTRDQAALTGQCLRAVLRMTDYPALRLIVVDNDSREAATAALLDDLQTDPRVQVLPSPGAFNFSALNNHAVATDNSEMVCFLNNDCEPLHPEWLAEMVALAAHQEVGLVGAKLLYPDETIQHAGLHLVGDNVAHHSFVGMAERDGGYMDRNNHLRNVAAVTGACMVMRRTVFDAVGGFDAVHFPIDFSDVDLCLRTRESGLQVVWTPHAVLTHHESASRGQFMSVAKETAHRAACQAMHERFGAALYDDPFYNPNLSFERADHQLAFPPRRR